MTRPTGPSQPPRPSGPRKDPVPVDPNTEAGQQAAEAISEVLAEIQVKVWRRRNSSKQHKTDAA